MQFYANMKFVAWLCSSLPKTVSKHLFEPSTNFTYENYTAPSTVTKILQTKVPMTSQIDILSCMNDNRCIHRFIVTSAIHTSLA